MNPTIAKTLKLDFTLVISFYFLIFSHNGPQTVVCFESHNRKFAVYLLFFCSFTCNKSILLFTLSAQPGFASSKLT